MKKLEAIIKPFKLAEVTDALGEVGITGMTVSEVMGSGRRSNPADLNGRDRDAAALMPSLKVEIVVAECHCEVAIKAVLRGARSGRIHDGKIFVTDIKQAIRIRTGEAGDSAVSDSMAVGAALQTL